MYNPANLSSTLSFLLAPHNAGRQAEKGIMNAAFREAANQARQKPVKLTHNQEVRALQLFLAAVSRAARSPTSATR